MNHLKITTAELSKICGVSQGTVDRALNNRADINSETKKRIIAIAKQYGYRKYIDSDVENKSVGQIGIIVFNLNNEYFSKLITETEFILRELGLSAVIMMTHYDKQYEIECIRNMYNMGVQGIILRICKILFELFNSNSARLTSRAASSSISRLSGSSLYCSR